MQETIFDKIIKNEVPSWKVFEDDNYLAFLTPFASTPGITIVIPKIYPGDYIFSLDDETYNGLMKATKKVAHALEKAFDTKVALVFEGTGVPHVHAKLYPMHNVYSFDESTMPQDTIFHDDYLGYITTQSGPMMDSKQLDEIKEKIQGCF